MFMNWSPIEKWRWNVERYLNNDQNMASRLLKWAAALILASYLLCLTLAARGGKDKTAPTPGKGPPSSGKGPTVSHDGPPAD